GSLEGEAALDGSCLPFVGRRLCHTLGELALIDSSELRVSDDCPSGDGCGRAEAGRARINLASAEIGTAVDDQDLRVGESIEAHQKGLASRVVRDLRTLDGPCSCGVYP